MNPLGYEKLPRRWYCSSCERIYKRPSKVALDGSRWHSWKCDSPMTLVDVELTAVSIGGDE